MENRTFVIPKENMPKLIEKLEKFNKKAVKLNCAKITITEIETRTRELEDEKGCFIEEVEIEVNGEIPVLNGWLFIATLQNDYEDTIIRRCNKDENIVIPQKYYHTDNRCEHCNTSRVRKEVYLIYNVDTKEFKQVGKTCLKDFINHNKVENYIRYLEIIVDLEDEIESNYGFNGCNFAIMCINIVDYLNYCKLIVDKKGYVSRGKSREENCRSTSDIAFDELICPPRYDKDFFVEDITEEQKEYVKKAIEWIRTKEIDENNEYMHNLKTICNGNFVDIKNIGFVASLLVTYYRETEKQKEREQKKQSEFVGTVGEKFVKELNYLGVIFFETMGIYNFEDENKNRYVWKSASGAKQEFKIGSNHTIQATIKEHEEYRESKQTVLTRVKNLNK